MRKTEVDRIGPNTCMLRGLQNPRFDFNWNGRKKSNLLFCHFPSVDSDAVAMVVRKQSENAEDFFNKDFKEYQDGFAANGKL